MKTAISWLEQEFIKLESTIGVHGKMYELIEQAKEMEKQQMKESFTEGYKSGITDYMDIQNGYDGRAIGFSQYYNETYGSKGSDEKKEPKDIVLGYKTSLEAQMLDSQIPQKEISDESWEGCDGCTEQDEVMYKNGYVKGYNAAISELPKELSDDEIDEYAKKNAFQYYEFITGAKWYREQLRQRK